MNTIAQSGSLMGNFKYVNTSNPDYSELVKDCLAESLKMALESDSAIKLQISNDSTNFKDLLATDFNYIYKDFKNDEVELTIDKISITVQTLIKTSIIEQELNVQLKVVEEFISLNSESICVAEPPHDIRLKARLRLVNK
jgi:hypothetical protein